MHLLFILHEALIAAYLNKEMILSVPSMSNDY